MIQPRARTVLALVFACSSIAACEKRELTIEKVGGVVLMMPLGSQRNASNEPADGFIEQQRPGKWSVELAWEPDPRRDPVSDEEALLAWGSKPGRLVQGAKPLRQMVGDAAAPASLSIDGHPAAIVQGASGEALIWRCEKTGRLFKLERTGPAKPGIELSTMAATARCHDYGSRPADAQVPSANLVQLGEGWMLGHRTHGTAIYLRDDALLTLFAGRKTEPADDLVVAAHLAPSWIDAAGLRDAHVETGERANGPQGHPAVSLRGEATLDGAPVRWTYLEWRCLQHARTYGALLVSKSPALPGVPAPSTNENATRAGWTGYDSALLAVRCHG